MEGENLNEAINLIQKDFFLEKDDLPISILNLDDLRHALNKVVSYLLDKDMTRLLNALYRIDVDESKVKKVLAEADPESISHEITDLIIQRELKKIETRNKYRSNF
jgi:hypothetical protein